MSKKKKNKNKDYRINANKKLAFDMILRYKSNIVPDKKKYSKKHRRENKIRDI